FSSTALAATMIELTYSKSVVEAGPERALLHLAHGRFGEADGAQDVDGSLFTSTTSAVSTATSVPAPTATPMSAWASVGASLTPSPTIATRFPSACSSRT